MAGDSYQILAFTIGTFAGSLLIAFLLSRLGLYLRRSSRHEPATVVGVHIICFFLLGAVACSAKAGSPGASGLTVFVAQMIVLLTDLLRLPRIEDYQDDVPQKMRALTGARLVAVAAAILLGFGLVYVAARPSSDQEIVAEIEAGIRGEPGGAIYLEALKRDFPREYGALATDTARGLRKARWNTAGSESETQLAEHFGGELRALVASKLPAMARAPTPALNAYSRSMKDNVLALQKTSTLTCAALMDGPVADEPGMRVDPVAREATARILASRLDLARAGSDHPTERQLSPPPAAALRQLADEVRRRGEAYLAKHGMTTPLARSCARAVDYYSAIADLPPETSALVAAYDLTAAAAPGSASTTAPPSGGRSPF